MRPPAFVRWQPNLTNEQLRRPIRNRWTVYSAFAHIAFWDLRVMQILEGTELKGELVAPEIDLAANDILNTLFLAIPSGPCRGSVRNPVAVRAILPKIAANS